MAFKSVNVSWQLCLACRCVRFSSTFCTLPYSALRFTQPLGPYGCGRAKETNRIRGTCRRGTTCRICWCWCCVIVFLGLFLYLLSALTEIGRASCRERV